MDVYTICSDHPLISHLVDKAILFDSPTITIELHAKQSVAIPDGYFGIIYLNLIEDLQSYKLMVYVGNQVNVTLYVMLGSGHQIDLAIDLIMCHTNSIVSLAGLSTVQDGHIIKVVTSQIHCGKNNKSYVNVKSLVMGTGKFYYQGMIRIEKTGAGTYASQQNKNILLSTQAQAVSIPNIEVLRHDVQCYHGAAIGKFDKEQLMYMQTRGLDALQSQTILIHAFIDDVVPDDKKNSIMQMLHGSL